jgi:hypothetical protein
MPTLQTSDLGRYDRSLIITVGADATISKNADYLRKSLDEAATVVHLSLKMLQRCAPFARAELKASMSELTSHSRVYLYGHGDWQQQTMGGATAEQLAQALADMPIVQLVSLICCDAAVDQSQGEKELRVSLSANSLASHLHKLLHEQGQKVTLYARTMMMAVIWTGAKLTSTQTDVTVTNLLNPKSKCPFSKVVFDWDGATQRRRWYDYAAKAPGVPLFPAVDPELTDLLAELDAVCTF